MAGHQVDQDHLPAVRLDELMAHHRLLAIIAALDEHARPQPADQVERRVVLEDRHEVNRLQRRQHAGAGVDVLDRAVGALEPLHRGIAVEADHQPVADGARG